MKEVYLGLDGDDVGRKIESYFIREEINKLKTFSNKINDTISDIAKKIIERNGEIIFIGGDNIFAKIKDDKNFILNLLEFFKINTGNKASAGIGNSSLEAYLALKYAKASRTNLIYYSKLKINE